MPYGSNCWPYQGVRLARFGTEGDLIVGLIPNEPLNPGSGQEEKFPRKILRSADGSVGTPSFALFGSIDLVNKGLDDRSSLIERVDR